MRRNIVQVAERVAEPKGHEAIEEADTVIDRRLGQPTLIAEIGHTYSDRTRSSGDDRTFFGAGRRRCDHRRSIALDRSMSGLSPRSAWADPRSEEHTSELQ